MVELTAFRCSRTTLPTGLKIEAPAPQPVVEAAPNLPHFGFDFCSEITGVLEFGVLLRYTFTLSLRCTATELLGLSYGALIAF